MLSQAELAAENDALKVQVKERDAHIEQIEKLNAWYEKQLKLNRQRMFGASSEKSEYAGVDQLNLFNEAEAEKQPISPEPTLEEITYKRKKKKGSREKLLEQLPVETIEYTLPESEQTCPQCGNAMHVMSKEVRKELENHPGTGERRGACQLCVRLPQL